MRTSDLPVDDTLEIAESGNPCLNWRMGHLQHLEGLKILCGGIVNDLNNLLMGIAGNTDLILLNRDSLEAGERLASVKSSVEKASELTFQLLSYISGDGTVVNNMDLKRAVSETLNMMNLPREKRAVIEVDLSKVPPVMADVSQMVRLIMNMIVNASEVNCRSRGMILISLFPRRLTAAELEPYEGGSGLEPGEYVLLRITDCGCGLHREALSSMFGSISEPGYAAGLSMHDTLQILRSNRGGISVVYPGNPDPSVTVCFPASSISHRLGTCDLSRFRCPSETGTVLVVDDDELVLNTSCEMLTAMGFTALAALDGCSAIELMRTSVKEIDCVLLDLNMPSMDGRQTFSIIRELSPDLPVILSSGHIREDMMKKLRETGVNGFLRKPYDVRALKRVIREVLPQSAERTFP